ncbi:hypothetical protein [Paenibacillus sp. Y412MC10]|uniref:hypothetical protein n=1 Tax=Geobacillus sp. (strain Y412MC10) TaxID=481743 RepID=UPI0011AB8478|nr:hypothetical protein [Paenibacillus sp. Y412MC10]
MDHTKILLRNLSAGELQLLAYDLLPQLYEDWQRLQMSGGMEGTSKTRKGTPDAWCERDNETLVYIQATADTSKGKIHEDLEKSIEQLKSLKKNKGALCIAFLSFDPQSDEIEKCKEYAKDNNCSFDYYSNSKISELLDEDFPELKEKYLDLKSSESNDDDDDFSIDPKLIEKIMEKNNSEYEYDELYIKNTFDELNEIDRDSRFVLYILVNSSMRNSGKLNMSGIKNKAIEKIKEVKFKEIIVSLETNNYISDDMYYGPNSLFELADGSLYDGSDDISYRLSEGFWNLTKKSYLFKLLRLILNDKQIFKKVLVSLESNGIPDFARNERG